MGKVIMSGIVPQLILPVTSIVLSTIAEGSVVKINEAGDPVEFYVAKHDYEPTLNGYGRTLLVRKDCCNKRQWHTSDKNVYSSCALDTWFNGKYKSFLDEEVQSAIATTEFYCAKGSGSTTLTTLSRAIFALSSNEVGADSNATTEEGSELPTAELLNIAYLNGSTVDQWLRSVSIYNSKQACYVNDDDGKAYQTECTDSNRAPRPCFTLPSDALFDNKTLEFKGVS